MDAAFIWNLSKLGRIGSRRLQFDDDFADRLNYQYTSVLLFLFIGLIGVRQYVGKPIQCWIPQEFTRGWEEYAENYCWVANTYFAPIENRLPPVPDRRELLLVYYQWAPIVMAAQALLFYLPCLMWRLGMSHSGFNLHRVLQMAAEANEMLPEATAKTVHILSHYMKSCIQRQRLYKYTNQFRNMGLYNRLVNEALNEKSQSHLHINTTENDEERECYLNTRQIHPYNMIYPFEPIVEENTFDVIPKTTIDNSVNTMKIQNEVILSNQSTEHLASSNSSSETLNKGRGRKPAPPPPPKMNSTSESLLKHPNVDRFEAESRSTEVQNIKSSENLINFQENKKKESTCKVSTENRKLSQTLKDFGKEHKNLSNLICWPSWCGTEQGNFLVTLYMLVKLSYLSNVIGQIYLMQHFIGTKYTLYGAQVLIDLIRGQEWHHSGHFPRVTFCDLEAKNYTLQCVLPLNMFLEKIYIFLWFWHVLIAFITLISFIIWFYRLFSPISRIKFITDHLKVLNLLPINKELKKDIEIQDFVNYYLGLDGLFVIRLITANCGILLAGELTAELWQSYKNLSNEQIIYQLYNKSNFPIIQHEKDTSIDEVIYHWKSIPPTNITYNSKMSKVTLNPKQNKEMTNHLHRHTIQQSKSSLPTSRLNDQSVINPCETFTQVDNSKLKLTKLHQSYITQSNNTSDDIV
ncbi:unnamed protein product [Heterobilharzia americana]|nr:unnamed protein product [Heterobilharzia americana]